MHIFKELDKFREISFKESDHSYLYNGKLCDSVTTVIGMYQQPFEREIIAVKYAKKHNLKVTDVLLDWEQKRDSASKKGTCVHAYAENLFQSKVYEDPYIDEVHPDLLKMVDNFYTDVSGKLILIKAELVVGDFNLGVCGMIDKLFYNVKSEELQIWDYKTNKDIRCDNQYGTKMLYGLSHLDDCEMNKYSLQLGLYKYIIEENTNIKIGNSYICWLNNEKNESYIPIKAIDFKDEIEYIVNDYRT